MNVRATRIVADPVKAAADKTASYQEMVASMKHVDGFLGALLLMDWTSGNSLGLTFWENEEKLRASEEVANKFRRAGADTIGATTPPGVERFEVVYYGVPDPSSMK
jgi:heme-degrading monooxygenase HmoA